MFLNYYGLREQAFGVTPDPDYLYLSDTHREALASLIYGIRAGVGFVATIAQPGMGKTTLLHALLRHVRSSMRTAHIVDTQCNSRELLQNLLVDFGIEDAEDSGNDSVPPLYRLKQFLLDQAREGRGVLVVLDEAQNLSESVLETVRLLSNFETSRAKLLQIVLAAQPQLDARLAQPEAEQLRQRISVVARLRPLEAGDVIRYVAHRLHRAGYGGLPLFTPGALAELVAHSKGIPREINRLCFNALSLGCALNRRVIDESVMREASHDVEFGVAPSAPQSAVPSGHDLAALFVRATCAEATAPTPHSDSANRSDREADPDDSVRSRQPSQNRNWRVLDPAPAPVFKAGAFAVPTPPTTQQTTSVGTPINFRPK